jgi:tetratricopeptide (TPR) repeat protein
MPLGFGDMAKFIAMMTLGVVLLAAGCGQPASPQGQAQLKLAREQLDNAQYLAAVQGLNNFLQREGGSRDAGDALYLRGLCYRRLAAVEASGASAKNELAEKDFREAIKVTRKNDVAALAHVALGHLYFEARPDEPQLAIIEYQAALPELKNESPLDAVLYRLGASLQSDGKWIEANRYFARCFTDFPQSDFVGRARQRFGARCWRLQWGAFTDLKLAQTQADALARQGVLVDWTSRQEKDVIVYLVQSGQFNTYAEARKQQTAQVGMGREVMIVPGNTP